MKHLHLRSLCIGVLFGMLLVSLAAALTREPMMWAMVALSSALLLANWRLLQRDAQEASAAPSIRASRGSSQHAGTRELHMAEHHLKTDPAVYDAVESGAKTHEVRLNDRGYQVGDTLALQRTRWSAAQMEAEGLPLEFTGQECRRVVTHILGEGGEGSGYGLQPGWCVLSLAPESASAWRMRYHTGIDGAQRPAWLFTENAHYVANLAGRLGWEVEALGVIPSITGASVPHSKPRPGAPFAMRQPAA